MVLLAFQTPAAKQTNKKYRSTAAVALVYANALAIAKHTSHIANAKLKKHKTNKKNRNTLHKPSTFDT